MKKDEKDAGSRFWYARISLASFESGYSALNLRSRDCSWRVENSDTKDESDARRRRRFHFHVAIVVRSRRRVAAAERMSAISRSPRAEDATLTT